MYNLENNEDCFLHCVKKISLIDDTNYLLLPLASWKFGYGEGRTVGEALQRGYADNIDRTIELLSEYCGINMVMRSDCNVESIENSIKKNDYVIVRCDISFCSWITDCEKLNGKHSILLRGKKNGKYLFEDQFAEKEITIDREFLIKYCFEMFVFEKEKKQKAWDIEDYKCELLKSALLYEKQHGEKKYKLFIKDLVNSFSFKEEVCKENILESVFLRYILFLIEDRRSFLASVRLMEMNMHIGLNELVDNLERLVNTYIELRVNLIKQYYLNKDEVDNNFYDLCSELLFLELNTQNVIKNLWNR